jgi:glycosyltransferase involved in cell wall biosynthesis
MYPSKVVLLIPAYNSERTIADTLESVQRQGEALRGLGEVVLADDKSTDRTREIARATWKTDVPLRVLEAARNRGEAGNVNEAVQQLPPGVEWFLILHADDRAKDNWLATMLEHVHAVPANTATICSSYDDWLSDGTIVPGENDLRRGPEDIAGTREAVRNTLIRGCWWHISACAMRVSAFRSVGGLPRALPLKGDWDLLLRFLSAGWGVRYVPRTLMLYRASPAGVSSVVFARHGDIPEILQVIRWHRAALSMLDVVRLHIARLGTIAWRVVSSLARLNFRRFLALFPVTMHVIHSLLQSLSKPEPRQIASL